MVSRIQGNGVVAPLPRADTAAPSNPNPSSNEPQAAGFSSTDSFETSQVSAPRRQTVFEEPWVRSDAAEMTLVMAPLKARAPGTSEGEAHVSVPLSELRPELTPAEVQQLTKLTIGRPWSTETQNVPIRVEPGPRGPELRLDVTGIQPSAWAQARPIFNFELKDGPSGLFELGTSALKVDFSADQRARLEAAQHSTMRDIWLEELARARAEGPELVNRAPLEQDQAHLRELEQEIVERRGQLLRTLGELDPSEWAVMTTVLAKSADVEPLRESLSAALQDASEAREEVSMREKSVRAAMDAGMPQDAVESFRAKLTDARARLDSAEGAIEKNTRALRRIFDRLSPDERDKALAYSEFIRIGGVLGDPGSFKALLVNRDSLSKAVEFQNRSADARDAHAREAWKEYLPALQKRADDAERERLALLERLKAEPPDIRELATKYR